MISVDDIGVNNAFHNLYKDVDVAQLSSIFKLWKVKVIIFVLQ